MYNVILIIRNKTGHYGLNTYGLNDEIFNMILGSQICSSTLNMIAHKRRYTIILLLLNNICNFENSNSMTPQPKGVNNKSISSSYQADLPTGPTPYAVRPETWSRSEFINTKHCITEQKSISSWKLRHGVLIIVKGKGYCE